MIKVPKNIFLFALILETALIFILGINNFQKTKAYLSLRLEIKSKEESLLNKEARVKELEKELEEIKVARTELEGKIQGLNETQKLLEGKVEGSKEIADVLTKQFDRQEKDIFKQLRSITVENRKTLLSLFSKIENLLNAKVALESELEKIKETGSSEDDTSQEVNLDKITVQKQKDSRRDNPEYVGSVLDVNNEYNFIIVDLGQEDNVKAGMKYYVLRSNKKIGEIILKEIYKGMSLAEPIINKTDVRLRRGDKLLPR